MQSAADCCCLQHNAAICMANAEYTLCISIIFSGLHSIWLQGDAVYCRLLFSATDCSILNGKLLSTWYELELSVQICSISYVEWCSLLLRAVVCSILKLRLQYVNVSLKNWCSMTIFFSKLIFENRKIIFLSVLVFSKLLFSHFFESTFLQCWTILASTW